MKNYKLQIKIEQIKIYIKLKKESRLIDKMQGTSPKLRSQSIRSRSSKVEK